MQKTVDFALWLKREYDVGMILFIATPLHGSRLHKICEGKGYLAAKLTPRSLAQAFQTWGSLITTQDFDTDDVKKIALQAMTSYRRLKLRNYLRASHSHNTQGSGVSPGCYALSRKPSKVVKLGL